MDDLQYPGTLRIARGLQFRHGHGVHVDSSRLGYKVDDSYSSRDRIGRLGGGVP